MYRKDARGTIEVDLNDPVYSLDQLIEKQRVIIDDRERRVQGWRDSIAREERLLDIDEQTMHRLEIARDAARKALGPSEPDGSES